MLDGILYRLSTMDFLFQCFVREGGHGMDMDGINGRVFFGRRYSQSSEDRINNIS